MSQEICRSLINNSSSKCLRRGENKCHSEVKWRKTHSIVQCGQSLRLCHASTWGSATVLLPRSTPHGLDHRHLSPPCRLVKYIPPQHYCIPSRLRQRPWILHSWHRKANPIPKRKRPDFYCCMLHPNVVQEWYVLQMAEPVTTSNLHYSSSVLSRHARSATCPNSSAVVHYGAACRKCKKTSTKWICNSASTSTFWASTRRLWLDTTEMKITRKGEEVRNLVCTKLF